MRATSKQRILFTVIIIGVVSGLTSSVFLHSLQWITQKRLEAPWFIWGLPVVGWMIPRLYQRFGFGAEQGLRLVLEEIHRPQQVISWTMTPLIYLTTLFTHGVGGSAGREGTALQMAAGLSEPIAKWLGISLHNRRWVLMAALSAGFSAALGAPWAGMIFGLEVIVVGRIDGKQWIECLIASFVAWGVAVTLNTPHFQPLSISLPPFSFTLFVHLLMLAILLGLISRCHVEAVRFIEKAFSKIPSLWRTCLGGALLLLLYLIFPLSDFQGLGLDSIRAAFQGAPSPWDPVLKLLLTALTLAVGFKGGEFVPLVFIGTTTASALAHHWQEPLAFFAALGFASLFGAASKTPWACAILSVEMFGWEIAPYALLVNLAAYAMAGPFGIYGGQRILQRRPRKPWKKTL